MSTAWVLSVGTELTLGRSVDTNSAWISRSLAALGFATVRHVTVADALEAQVAAIREACTAAPLVVLTGGLGPTADDLTRAALADAAGDALVEDEQSLAQIRAFFTRRNRTMPEPNRVQAQRPASAAALANPTGTAPGIHIRIGSAELFALPGVPSEMRRMFDDHVVPALRGRGGRVLVSRELRCCGLGESDLGARIHDLMARGRNPDVGTAAKNGIITVRIYAAAPTADEAEALIAADAQIVRERLGRVVFGEGEQTLAAAVLAQLRARGRTLCTAESCTGGLVAKWLTDVPGSSESFAGAVVAYSNAAKRDLLGVSQDVLDAHGAVSAACAEALAAGARARMRTDYAIAITGIAGPGGGSAEKPVGLVYAALAGEAGVRARELRLGDDIPRDQIRIRAATAALNDLRLRILSET